jgi:hypothetical protein
MIQFAFVFDLITFALSGRFAPIFHHHFSEGRDNRLMPRLRGDARWSRCALQIFADGDSHERRDGQPFDLADFTQLRLMRWVEEYGCPM